MPAERANDSVSSSLKAAVCWLITRLAALDLAWPAAKLARLLMRTAPQTPAVRDAKDPKAGKTWRVLLLPRTRFNDDTMSMLQAVGSLEVVKLPRNAIKAVAAAFLPDELGDNNYLSNAPGTEQAKLRYRKFLMRFWRYLDPNRRIDAVMTGNFGYYAEREFAAALEALGVPFIALHKENFWSKGSQEFWERVYRERRGPFLGRRILVYSPIERDLQLRAGVVDAPRIEVVGMPRLDDIHRWRTANVGAVPKPMVLFAAFHPDVSMPVLRRDASGSQGGERWTVLLDERNNESGLENLCRSAHRAVLDLASACPDIAVVVKTKGRARDRALLDRLGFGEEANLPSNLRIVHGGSPLSFLFEASVVCGLHSTLLIEGLAAGRPVVVPWFGEVLDPEISRYIVDLRPAAAEAASAEEFTEKLTMLARARMPVPDTLPSATIKILHEWLGNEDGRAGDRAAAAISRVIETNCTCTIELRQA
jgi:hypothetical protein